MEDHPIQGLMKTAMENIKDMVDVNTIIGDPVQTPDGSIIIPVSRVSFGFAAGGSEFETENDEKKSKQELPFGGGSGGGVTVQPVAFLIAGGGQVRLLPVDRHAMLDRLIDLAPQALSQLQGLIDRNGHNGQGNIGKGNNGQTRTNYQI